MQAKTPQLSQTMATNLKVDSITWGNSINEGTGQYPSVVLLKYMSATHNNDELWYRVGMVNTDSKTWEAAISMITDYNPMLQLMTV